MRDGFDPIEAEQLRQLYDEAQLSSAEIAARVRCFSATVLRALRRFGIQTRTRGPAPHRRASLARLDWSPELAYAVGLTATDGNLSADGRHMSFVSKDREVIETYRRCLEVTSEARTIRSRMGRTFYRVQWCDRPLYDWFVAIGLMPAKSLRLGPLAVPDERFADFFRGCVDGDGSILVYMDRYHSTKNANYVYERLYVTLVSASRPFVEWIQATVGRLVGVSGGIHDSRRQARRPIFVLRYAKAESLRVLSWMYYSTEVPCLTRKRVKAEPFLVPLGYSSLPSVGRPRVGWLYNTKPKSGRGGVTAAARDSKSRAREGGRGQLPPPVPT